MEEVFLNKFKGFLTFIIPCVGFNLPYEFEYGLINGGELGNESNDIL